MDLILNLWQEQLHHIMITTKNGRKLSIHIDQNASGYLLNGEFFEIAYNCWYLVSFSQSRVSDPVELLKVCLKDLHEAMKLKNDEIKKIHNTCNMPIVSEGEQLKLIAELNITAEVAVN